MHAWACVPPERRAQQPTPASPPEGGVRPVRGKSRPLGLAGHSFRPAARLSLFSAGARASSALYGRRHPRRRVLFSGRSRSRIDGCSNLFSPAIDRLLLARGREERPLLGEPAALRDRDILYCGFRRLASVFISVPSGAAAARQVEVPRPADRLQPHAHCSFVIVHLPAVLPRTRYTPSLYDHHRLGVAS
ncbi:hypothetical protein MTO96_011663 [Rhipicephalus appendiculatus]